MAKVYIVMQRFYTDKMGGASTPWVEKLISATLSSGNAHAIAAKLNQEAHGNSWIGKAYVLETVGEWPSV